MTTEEKDILAQRYLQNDLKPEELEEMDLRLESDIELKELLEYYRNLIDNLESIPEVELPANLWSRKIKPALTARLNHKASLARIITDFFRNLKLKNMKPAFAVLSFIIVIIGVTIVLQQQLYTEPQRPYERALERIEDLRAQFLSELSVLMEEMDERKEYMSPEMRRVYDETLASIDRAIADAERFYALYSDDQEAISTLLAVYDQKAEFLQKFIQIGL